MAARGAHPPACPRRHRRDSGGGSVPEAPESWGRLSDDGKAGSEELGDGSPLRHRPRGPPPLFGDQPDLSCLIDTDFSAPARLPEPRHRGCYGARGSAGYDFHRLVQRMCRGEGLVPAPTQAVRPPSPGPAPSLAPEDEEGSLPEEGSAFLSWAPSADGAIWSLELQGSLIVVGRSSGRLEVGGAGWRGRGGASGRPLAAFPAQVSAAAGLAGVGRRRGHAPLQQRGGLLGHHGARLPGQKVGVLGSASPSIDTLTLLRFESWLPSLLCDFTSLLLLTATVLPLPYSREGCQPRSDGMKHLEQQGGSAVFY